MIVEECFIGIPQIIGCVWAEVFGSMIYGAFFGLIILAYILYKAGLNMTVSIPLAFLAIFSLYWIAFEGLFQSLMLVIMFFGAAILGFALWRYFKR